MITLAPTEEQTDIAQSVRTYLDREVPLSRIRALGKTDDGIDEALWNGYAELGWFGLSVAEELGGVGLGVAEEALLMVEAGRALAPGALRSQVLAARIAAGAENASLVESIVAGERRAGILVGDLAIGARAGDLVVVVDHDGGRLHEIDSLTPVPAVDTTTRAGRVVLGAEVARTAEDVLSVARVLLSAELLGVIEAVRDMSASYAQTREQFGKPIGTFQAVKHRCADMAVAAYSVRAQTLFAATKLDAGAEDGALQASLAYGLAVPRAQKSTKDNIQNHGGIGFTWEQDSHLYLKRAFLLGRLLGTPRDTHRDVLEPARNDFR